MLSVEDIKKQYVTGDLVQTALDGVTLNLRDSEFVAVLGPSGSGKTTLLNVIGGLDRYDSGDLVINGVSTKNFTDRDWDAYRNHSVGFVFQSYNLIGHQSILSNVELALTISGVSKQERRARAQKALEDVGLGDQSHKRPNQLSGGQMQRVAIARALVNDPEVLLADEPTGALDTVTSEQIMALLQEVAADRLVVMVTHNPELAEEYATRTITLRDGKVTSDSDPYEPLASATEKPRVSEAKAAKASMSWATSLTLSFNNLLTKKGRTLLTAFAGSIGIIGIAMILSLSNGVNKYISDTQRETMASYPITIDAETFDATALFQMGNTAERDDIERDMTRVHGNPAGLDAASTVVGSITRNNLVAFKEYLEDPESQIHEYIGEHGVVYSYPVAFSAYSLDPNGVLVNSDGSTFETEAGTASGVSQLTQMTSGAPMFTGQPASSGASTGAGQLPTAPAFQEIMPGANGEPVGSIIENNYELLEGTWPTSAEELVLILDKNNEVPTSVLYTLGLLPAEEYEAILAELEAGQTPEIPEHNWKFDELIGHSFKMLTASDYFEEREDGTFELVTDSNAIEQMVEESGKELLISGIIRPVESSADSPLSASVGYTNLLTQYIVEHTDNSPVVQAQVSNPDINVLTGVSFSVDTEDEKIADAIAYLQSRSVSEKANLARTLMVASATESNESANEDASSMGVFVDPATGMAVDGTGSASASPSGEVELAAYFDNHLLNDPDRDFLLGVFDSQLSGGTYESNMSRFGVVDLASPSSISIYADSFEAKDGIIASIDAYNETVPVEDQITFTDFIGLLMSTITTIINVISYVLIAFVAVSLVVSSIMIGIITFISVLERTKEIGILRSLGASKRNISEVFNAETLIVGLLSGALGILVTLLLLIPGNWAIHQFTGITEVSAALPWGAAIGLVVLSMVLTLIAGIIPSRIAANKDPVAALRME